jgi:CRP-like cAMP-binding protein
MKNETRRSGLDRREYETTPESNMRKTEDRRVANRDADNIVEFLKNIPLFRGLSDDQYRRLLNICTLRTIKKESFLCHEGDGADELFVLVKGKFKVLISGSILVNFISPMGLVGEIGVFTNVKRSASVLAHTDCTVLRLHKNEVFALMKNDYTLSQTLLLNVIRDLAGKLVEENQIIEELRNRKSTMVL